VLLIDCGAPPPAGLDRFAHAGTLSIELSVGRERLIVNCGDAPAGGREWHDAARSTAAHSTLVVADTNSAEPRQIGLGRRPEKVEVQRQEANGAHWLEASHDGYASHSARFIAAVCMWLRAARTSAAKTQSKRMPDSPMRFASTSTPA
jgi:uncharacterized heparinase superfamily protein